MKPENVTVGHHKVGPFDISVQRPVFRGESEESINYFETWICRKDSDGMTFYVDPKELEGFMFLQFAAFERKLTDDDVVEYNAHVNSKGLIMPTHLMSRLSIVKLLDVLETHAKKLKKKK
jgi:hypothetical protein